MSRRNRGSSEYEYYSEPRNIMGRKVGENTNQRVIAEDITNCKYTGYKRTTVESMHGEDTLNKSKRCLRKIPTQTINRIKQGMYIDKQNEHTCSGSRENILLEGREEGNRHVK